MEVINFKHLVREREKRATDASSDQGAVLSGAALAISEMVGEQIARLPWHQRTVLRLRYFERGDDSSYEETAERMNSEIFDKAKPEKVRELFSATRVPVTAREVMEWEIAALRALRRHA